MTMASLSASIPLLVSPHGFFCQTGTKAEVSPELTSPQCSCQKGNDVLLLRPIQILPQKRSAGHVWEGDL